MKWQKQEVSKCCVFKLKYARIKGDLKQGKVLMIGGTSDLSTDIEARNPHCHEKKSTGNY